MVEDKFESVMNKAFSMLARLVFLGFENHAPQEEIRTVHFT